MKQPHLRDARRAQIADLPDDRRSWLSHGLVALGISGLGLAIAGSMSLTTNAQTTDRTAGTSTHASKVVAAAVPGQVVAPTKKPPAAASAFLRETAVTQPSRSANLRAAIVKERAAQRSEALAKTAEDITRAVRDKASAARQKNLDATDRAIQENAVKLAWARQQRAIAARVAASNERASLASNQSTTTTADPSPDVSTVPTGGGAASPITGGVIGARFGQWGSWSRYHTGLDFRAAYGTPIHAAMAGVVVFAGNSGDWAGNHVAVRHADGMTTMYSHMSAIAAQVGQTVQAGQVIGYVGQTGRAFGAHLHFELYPVGVTYGDVYRAIDPIPWLHAHGVVTH